MNVSTIQEKELLARGADSQRDSSSSAVSASASERGVSSGAGSAKNLGAVLAGVDADAPGGSENLKIQHVACDSRKVQAGSLFFALHGAKADGNAFVRDAVTRGAAAIASEEDAPADLPANVAWVRVREARKALALTCGELLWASSKRVENGGRDRNEWQDDHDVGDRRDCESFRSEDRIIRDDRVSHSARGVSGAKYHAGVGGFAGRAG